MSNPTIRVSLLVFGIGEFKDEEDYHHAFAIVPSGILYPTLFVEDSKTGIRNLNLEMTIKLSDVKLVNRLDEKDVSMPWTDKDASIDLSMTGKITADAVVSVQYSIVTTNVVLADNESIKLVSYKLDANITKTNQRKRLT